MNPTVGLGLGKSHNGEVRIGFRTGWVRYVVFTAGSASLVGLAFAAFGLAEKQSEPVFNLLAKWGFVWLIALMAMILIWDLAKNFLAYFGKLADSVQQTAVAMNRIADKDDRERDRMVTETAFVGRRVERLTDEIKKDREDRKLRDERMEALLQRALGDGK